MIQKYETRTLLLDLLNGQFGQFYDQISSTIRTWRNMGNKSVFATKNEAKVGIEGMLDAIPNEDFNMKELEQIIIARQLSEEDE